MLAAYQIHFSRATALAPAGVWSNCLKRACWLRSLASWILSTFAALHGDRAGDQSLDAIAQQGIASGNVLVCDDGDESVGPNFTRGTGDCIKPGICTTGIAPRCGCTGTADVHRRALLVGLGDLACEWHDFDAASHYFHEGIALIEQWNEMVRARKPTWVWRSSTGSRETRPARRHH
jgi:hypothetical protein